MVSKNVSRVNNYFLYARKSTDVEDKQVRSIEDQLSVARALAKREGLLVVREFTEKETAKKPGRPVFGEMMARIEKGEAQGVICWKLDRLSRNPWDDGWIRWLHQIGTIQHVRTCERDYQSGDNTLLMAVEFATANQYIIDLAANTKRGLHEKARRGEYPTIAPIGYLNDPRRKTIIVDRRRAKVVKEAFRLYAEGNSTLENIADYFKTQGVFSKNGYKLSRDRITNILSNPFYYGNFRYAGEIYEGKHEPLITKKLFDKAQEVMKRRGWQDRKENEPRPLCGLLRCGECGCSITAEEKTKRQKNGNVHHYVYYHCTKKKGPCSQPCIREEILSNKLSDILQNYVLPSDWAMELSKMTDKDEAEAVQSSATASQAMREEVATISSKLKRLRSVYIDEDIEREEYLVEKAELLSLKKSLEEKMADLRKGTIAWLEPLRGWIKDAETLGEIVETADLPLEKSSAQKIFGSNLSLKDSVIQFTPITPYDALRASRDNFSEKDRSLVFVPSAGIEPAFFP